MILLELIIQQGLQIIMHKINSYAYKKNEKLNQVASHVSIN